MCLPVLLACSACLPSTTLAWPSRCLPASPPHTHTHRASGEQGLSPLPFEAVLSEHAPTHASETPPGAARSPPSQKPQYLPLSPPAPASPNPWPFPPCPSAWHRPPCACETRLSGATPGKHSALHPRGSREMPAAWEGVSVMLISWSK